MRFQVSALLWMALCLVVAPVMAAEVVLTIAGASLPAETDAPGSDVVHVRLDPDSARKFAEFSGQHIGEMAEFYLDDQLVFSARLSEAITSGNLALFVGAGDERIGRPQDLLERFEAGVPIRVIAPSMKE